MIRKFNTRLLFTDTDGLFYELHEKTLYKKMQKYKELFDLGNFPKSIILANIIVMRIKKQLVK